MHFTIRAMRPGDLAAVQDLQCESFAVLARSHHSQGQIDAHSALIRHPSYGEALAECNLVVAATDAGLLGTAGWCPLEGEPATARIRKVFVSPDAAGQGLGRRLVSAAESGAEAAGFSDFFVRANANAAAFYEQLGYARLEEGVMETLDDVDLPVVFLRKAGKDTMAPQHPKERAE